MLVDEPGDPAWNMAVDAALLACAETPTLRLYGWRPHAVSLGYFQAVADFDDLPAETPLVRRLTGGGAIAHGDELTYSLALDAALLPGEIAASYVRLHDALIRALARLGARCERAVARGTASARPRDRWCFRHPVRDDLVTERGKLCGSAQRRAAVPRPRLLHHGSLVLRRPALTTFVAALEDQVPLTESVRRDLRTFVVEELAEDLGMEPAAGSISEQELVVATQLQRDVFAAPAHLHRR
ncbi:MAG: lipoate--protein ligase family protein [Planctomycetes bacterium]|nr:lipoate--protein ligase family protein [Planctomycetota bacterium]